MFLDKRAHGPIQDLSNNNMPNRMRFFPFVQNSAVKSVELVLKFA